MASDRRVGDVGGGSGVLRVIVYAASTAAFTFPLASTRAVISATLGAALGAAAGPWLSASRVRSSAVVAGFALAVMLSLGVLRASWMQALFVDAWGPTAALATLRQSQYFAASALIACGLAVLSARHRLVSFVEVGFCATAIASLVIGHRYGAINRPFEIADPIIASGGDPTFALLAIGVVAAALTVLILMRERGLGRSLLHLLVVAALLLLVFKTTRYLGLPEPPSGAGLGLRSDKESSGKPQQQQSGGRPRDRANNEDLEFRDDNSPSRNQTPVAVVLLHDDYSPPRGLYYFRQGAFSQYNGRRLVSATLASADQDLIASFPSAPTNIAAAPGGSGMRATLDTTVALMAEHARPFALEAPLSVKPEPNPDPSRFKRVYRVTSAALTADEYALLGRDVFDPTWNNELRAHYIAAPPDPRYQQLAKEILADVREDLRNEPAVKALAITEWLGHEATYSLKTKHSEAEDPTADFLFGDKIGYCVHFAHAAAYLLRAAGVPTRVATGYVVEESARQGGSAMVLTSANSHAWPEVYIDGAGWVVMDISPERSLDPPPPPPDPDLQRLLGQLARGEQPTAAPDARNLQPLIAALGRLGDVIARALVVALLLSVVALYTIKAWRRVAPTFASPSQLPRVLYRAQLDRLAEARLARARGESREAFARRLQDNVPSFEAFTRQHVALAFGSRQALAPTELRRLSQQTRSELNRSTAWWRRGLGLLTPWSWLRVR